ncbi:serine protease, S1-C subfamily, contains C-terminal PDZ domain [Halogranum amylolyticum]|uniref:Serine protease, S1-C subfamily, contains C-terminal PDZ domain n=1 Tax=Halogranum amylolyticum TaxID=660520 RepID=A0A1H8SWX0_9EURY|nr:trypsin-like peptidase domain-containing protein [Halogranum amylolyticum]SEO82838.1 serine protease, S1-C subfamily, contains C-terminal PDZ domain [Halogranum amylolyticum]
MKASRRRFLAGLGSVALGASAGCSSPRSRAPTASPTGDDATSQATVGDEPYTRAYRSVVASVVLVRVYGTDGRAGQGSGFVYDDRHLVTNEHVVRGSSEVRVRFREGEWAVADVVGTDVYSDLAVLRVPNRPDYATPLSLVESEPPVGTRVVAVGAPFDLGGSVSAGIVSGQDRALPSAAGFTIPDAVQTDAAVNPGNSGGPLVTLDGEVAGIINSGGGDNIGFAISAALARRVVPALVEDGRYDHPFVGVQLQEVSPLVAEANDLGRARGVVVVRVIPDGPAAGVLRGSDGRTVVEGTEVPVGGDVVVGVDGTTIRTQADLGTYLALETSPGDTVMLTVLRSGKRRQVEVTLGSRPTTERES